MVKPLQKLLWLSLDNNGLEEITETALYSMGELQYLNLESNRWVGGNSKQTNKQTNKKIRPDRE